MINRKRVDPSSCFLIYVVGSLFDVTVDFIDIFEIEMKIHRLYHLRTNIHQMNNLNRFYEQTLNSHIIPFQWVMYNP